MLSQSGVLASSKSASHTFAPELRALIVIFWSVGPVISTRRSASPGAGGATRQAVSARMLAVSGRKSSGAAGGQFALAGGAGGQQLGPPGAELALQRGDQGSAPPGSGSRRSGHRTGR